jgi:hypothetical protein
MDKISKKSQQLSTLERQYADFEPASVPIAPDGGVPIGFAMEPPPAPPVSKASICAQGPCRHYWELVTMAGEGNPSGTFEGPNRLIDPLTKEPVRRPRQHHYICLVNPGMETVLNDDCVYECSRWDPLSSAENAELARRRKVYWDAHPAVDESIEGLEEEAYEGEEGELDGSQAPQG